MHILDIILLSVLNQFPCYSYANDVLSNVPEKDHVGCLRSKNVNINPCFW